MKKVQNRAQPRSMPCPNCHRLISIDTAQCMHCGYRWPRLTLAFPLLGKLINEEISFSDKIILACFILYALAIVLDLPHAVIGGGLFNLMSPSPEALYRLGSGGTLPWSQGHWWSLLTANYLHGSILHILFNMLWLRQLGPLVEELFGHSRFLVIYTLAGIAGSVASILAGTPLFVGASGAIFGLFAALIFYGWRRGGVFGRSIFRYSLIWAGIGIVFGLVMPGVDNWGHVGGFIGGLLLAILMGYQEKGRQKLWHHMLALLTVLGILACFAVMMVAFFTHYKGL